METEQLRTYAAARVGTGPELARQAAEEIDRLREALQRAAMWISDPALKEDEDTAIAEARRIARNALCRDENASPFTTPEIVEIYGPGFASRPVVHGCPRGGSALTTCCGKTPFELPRTDRLTLNESEVTCILRSETDR